MATDSKYIKTIISANNDNSLAIFVGAGISKSCETKSFKLPTWNDLIEDLKTELDVNNETDYLKVAQLYYLAFGEFTYYRKLKEYFPDYITPSKVHKQIFELNPHIIITTNWDNILEKAVEENAYIYDLVVSDNDLVKSSLPNKLIKMHGDFKNHNIVFKEDDYINYQYNFPLIENYVKSILSTHTVLFLGYSYNDINLKQLVKWIQNHSKVRPPMYLIAFQHNANQIKYLENHGITTIVIEEISEQISTDANLDLYSQKMQTFLARIANKDEKSILANPEETIDFVLSKLDKLSKLEGILIEQIQSALTNCGFIFDSDSKPILEFYDERLTSDINKSVRNIYEKFVEILKEVDKGAAPSPKIIRIFDILSKARIKGIVISKKDLQTDNKDYIPFSEYIKINEEEKHHKYYDFDFDDLTKQNLEVYELFNLAFKFYSLYKKEEAFALIEESIILCIKKRDYTWLFIAMFNRNILLDHIMYDIKYHKVRGKYEKYEKYNLKERYHNLTRDLKFALEPIYEFIDFSFIYRYAFNISEELKKTEDAKRTVELGGFVLHSDIFKFSAKHENLVSFVLENKIMIENFKEYKTINKAFVKIALMRQVQKEISTLTKTELYACIKYIDFKEIKVLLEEYYDKDSVKKGTFQLPDDLKDWMINSVFTNSIKYYLNDKNSFNKFEEYIENIIFLLSLTKLNEDEVEKILKQLSKIVEEGRNTLNIFQSINLFFGIQYNLYNLQIREEFLISLIETLINKLVYKRFTGHEYMALTRNELSNLYGYARQRKAVLKNEDLIDKLLEEVKGYSISDKIEITQNFILKLYEISNNKIKDKIKRFSLSINSSDEKEEYKKLIFDLTLVIYDFKEISKEIIDELDKYLEQFKSGKSFSTVLYTLGSQIDYLISNKKAKGLEEVAEVIKTAILSYKERDQLAIF